MKKFFDERPKCVYYHDGTLKKFVSWSPKEKKWTLTKSLSSRRESNKWDKNFTYNNKVGNLLTEVKTWTHKIAEKTEISISRMSFGAPYGGWETRIFYEFGEHFTSCKTEARTFSELLLKSLMILKTIYCLVNKEVYIYTGGFDGIYTAGIMLPETFIMKKVPAFTEVRLKIRIKLYKLRMKKGKGRTGEMYE